MNVFLEDGIINGVAFSLSCIEPGIGGSKAAGMRDDQDGSFVSRLAENAAEEWEIALKKCCERFSIWDRLRHLRCLVGNHHGLHLFIDGLSLIDAEIPWSKGLGHDDGDGSVLCILECL